MPDLCPSTDAKDCHQHGGFCVLGAVHGASIGSRAFTAGLAQVTVLSSVIFAGISGSALADIAGLGPMQIETMRRAGLSAPPVQ